MGLFIMKTKILSVCFFFVIVLMLSGVPVLPQNSEWVIVEGMAPIENVTKNEARKIAIANARREAVEKVVGVNILDEIIHILALKEPMNFNTAKFQEGIYGVYDGRSAMVSDLVKNIVGIPLSHRAEKFIQYRITKQQGNEDRSNILL